MVGGVGEIVPSRHAMWVLGFVGEDSILPLKLDVFRFGRLIAYPYNVVISFGGSKPPPYVFDNIVFSGKCGRIWNRPTVWKGTSLEKCCENIICQGIDKFAI